MDLFQALILGGIEGLTEFLPISSTGHLIIASELLRISHTEFHKTFEIAIQSGSMFAVLFLYARAFLSRAVLVRLFAAFVPTALIGLMLYSIIKQFSIGNVMVVLVALFLGGIVLILFETWYQKRHPHLSQSSPREYTGASIKNMRVVDAFWVGVCQSVALIPGVSRSGAAIIGGLARGIPRTTIVAFSFLLAVPTLFAATGLDLVRTGWSFTSEEIGLLFIGSLTSCLVAIGAIRFLLSYVSTHNFIGFGIYRMVAAIVFALIIYL